MEIEVGEYIRTRNGVIAKLIDIYFEEDENCYHFDNTIYRGYSEYIDFLWEKELKEYIVKHSEFIWELIELGDYVNGHKVEEIWENDFRFGGCDYTFQVTGYEIKSIVTKEQFESMEYKVGEE